MNPSAPASNPCPRAATPGREPAPAAQRQPAREAFERALTARRERCGESGEEALPDGLALALAAGAPLPRAAPAPAALSGGVELAAGGCRAAIETALRTPDLPPPIGAADPASVWEATLPAPQSIPLELRAMRSEDPGQEAPRVWDLTLRAPSAAAELLAQHAPRLRERLRSHGVAPEHVRIEGRTDENA